MAVVQTAVGNQNGGLSAPVTASYGSAVSTSNRLIAVVEGAYSTPGNPVTGITVTDNKGNTWTRRAQVLSNNTGAVIYDCVPTTGGTGLTVTGTFAGSSDTVFAYLALFEVSGLSGFDTANTASGTSTSASVSTTALAASSGFVVGGFTTNGTSDHAETSGTYTNLVNDPTDVVTIARIDYKTVASNAAATVTYSPLTSELWVAAIAAWSASGGGVSGSLAASESPDTASFAAQIKTNTTLAATETADALSFNMGAPLSAALGATETADTAALNAQVITSGSLTVTETTDVASFAAQIQTLAPLAATDTPDTAAFTATIALNAAWASTDTPDTAALVGQVSTTLTLAVTENPDVLSFVSGFSALLAATDAPDTASFGLQIKTSANFAATDAADTASFSALVNTNAALAVTEPNDLVSFSGAVLSPITGTFAVTENLDVASFSVSIYSSLTYLDAERFRLPWENKALALQPETRAMTVPAETRAMTSSGPKSTAAEPRMRA